MSDLSNTVHDYYVSHFNELQSKTQFHFASRLFLWQQDEFASQQLAELKPWFTSNDNPISALQQVYDDAVSSRGIGSKNAANLRQPFFDSYPNLMIYVSVLFRITFLKTIYNFDTSASFYDLFDQKDVESDYNKLLNDYEALAILSTHAINFIYLYNEVILSNLNGFNPDLILQVGHEQYDINEKIELQLLIYLYTHCIIGETLFYSKNISTSRMGPYKKMISELNKLIDQNYLDINLDNKFEYLTCANILGIESSLRERIFDEANRSISTEGDFIIDRHNNNPQLANTSLDKAEHRNVLYLLSNAKFSPVH